MTAPIKVPSVTFSVISSGAQATLLPHRPLGVGQKTINGTAVDGVLVSVLNDRDQWATLFGRSSMLFQQVNVVHLRPLNAALVVADITLRFVQIYLQ